MRIDPYLAFNGNCSEAIALYEKAFNSKASEVMRHGDAPPSEGYTPAPGTENLIMHATIPVGESGLMVCDSPGETYNFGNGGASFHVAMDDEDCLKAAFDILKEGGTVEMAPEKTFWSNCFCSLTDKFGVWWMLSV